MSSHSGEALGGQEKISGVRAHNALKGGLEKASGGPKKNNFSQLYREGG